MTHRHDDYIDCVAWCEVLCGLVPDGFYLEDVL